MTTALFVFLVSFCLWIFFEFRKASVVWLRLTTGLLAFASLFAFAFYGLSGYFGYSADVQMQMIQETKYLAEDVGSDAALKFLDSYVPKIKKGRNIPTAMHSLLRDFQTQADELRKTKTQQTSPANHRPSGTSGMASAGSASRAEAMPEASGDS